MQKKTIGLTEEIVVYGKNKSETVIAKIDTGTTTNSIDSMLAKKLCLGPVIKTAVVKSANGKSRRHVVEADILLAGERVSGSFTIADRNKMKYCILVGRQILKKTKFLIDPHKKNK